MLDVRCGRSRLQIGPIGGPGVMGNAANPVVPPLVVS